MKSVICLAFVFGCSIASANRESGGRLSALADSKMRISAALEKVTDLGSYIKSIFTLPDGKVKVEVVSQGICRAVIFDIVKNDSSYEAVNPQRSICQ